MFQLKTALVSASVAFMLGCPRSAEAIPIFQRISPAPKDFLFAVNGDFTQYPGSAVGDLTGVVEAVGLADPIVPALTLSGCHMSDFAGFVAGSIALMQRGGCTFGQKAANAAAAGAIGALIFEDGLQGGNIVSNVGYSLDAGIPTFITTFDIGVDFATSAEPVTVREVVSDVSDSAFPVPEPTSFGILACASLSIAFARSGRVGPRNTPGAGERRVRPDTPRLGRPLEIPLDICQQIRPRHGLVEAITAMPGAALLLDRQGRIVFANAAAENLLAENDGLGIGRAGSARLSAEDDVENAILAGAIRRSIEAATGIVPAWSAMARISRRSDKPSLVVLLTPLPSPFHPFSADSRCDPGILVQILGSADWSETRVATFAKIYGLTLSETRVAAAVGCGLSAPQAATHLCVSLNTVKTHLRRCFDKTGMRSQVELARLMALTPNLGSISIKGRVF